MPVQLAIAPCYYYQAIPLLGHPGAKPELGDYLAGDNTT